MGTASPSSAAPFRLCNLPLPARLVLSAFLISVGCGYFAALVQLHFQHASPGHALPNHDDVVRRFYGQLPGEKPKCKLQMLLEADENLPFNGSGQMKAAFFKKSSGWDGDVKKRAKKLAKGSEPSDEHLKQAEDEVRNSEGQQDTERLALLEWIDKGADKQAYEDDSFRVSGALATALINDDLLADAPADGGRAVKIKTIVDNRCVKCHDPSASSNAAKYPLDSFEHLEKYLKVNESQAISKEQLIQSTHVHLLSFSMLYALTGIIFAFTGLPAVVRFLIAPLPLVAQLADIACWWLTRIDPRFADGIIISGGVVAAGLGLHIVLSLFSMYGKAGKAVLLLLLVGAGLGAWQAKERYVDPYIAAEKPAAAAEK